MAFCTTCGNQVNDAARFCPSCGKPTTANAAPPPDTPPLDYKIEGDNLQILRFYLKPGQEVFAEGGKMVYKTPNVDWESKASGSTIGEKLWGMLKRSISGESLFFTHFRSRGDGEVGFAGSYPGRLEAIRLGPGQTFLAQRDSFICGQAGVQFNVAFVKKLGAGLFGGEGFILEKFTGPGWCSSTAAAIL